LLGNRLFRNFVPAKKSEGSIWWNWDNGDGRSRSECVALNGIAEEICKNLDAQEK
jgi:hypothetical protein